MKNAIVSTIAAALLAARFTRAQDTVLSTAALPTDTQSETLPLATQTPSTTFLSSTITSSASLTRSTDNDAATTYFVELASPPDAQTLAEFESEQFTLVNGPSTFAFDLDGDIASTSISMNIKCQVTRADKDYDCQITAAVDGITESSNVAIPTKSLDWQTFSATVTAGQELMSLPTAEPGAGASESGSSSENGVSRASVSAAAALLVAAVGLLFAW
ncbi:uncharacterized protein AB675_5560 [Cyphellophora attinorum]|uniref:Uncharacterized protein n=1 Tax=Cyphellophora attinorum TaxID=1664694 RepID=A0A0N1HCN3_9EURO|nr:uncharacterized protein AB675_5560 [Phialophora attinorum]KPI42166.1 hypothetical protein AB675_5560 [Phialophora attinorum]